MQHYEDGGKVNVCLKAYNEPWTFCGVPSWDWYSYDYRTQDEFLEHKQAQKDGAIFEVFNGDRWDVMTWEPQWDCDISKYRIKGNISMPSWDAHKEIIKAFWRGKKIEYSSSKKVWYKKSSYSLWKVDLHYRVAPKTTKLTISEIEKMLDIKNLEVIDTISCKKNLKYIKKILKRLLKF